MIERHNPYTVPFGEARIGGNTMTTTEDNSSSLYQNLSLSDQAIGVEREEHHCSLCITKREYACRDWLRYSEIEVMYERNRDRRAALKEILLTLSEWRVERQ
jgi:hypothetical protein